MARMKYLFCLQLFLLVFLVSFVHAETSYSFSSREGCKHFQNFIKEVRCVVCQNQSLADSSAPLANDLRDKIYALMVAKKTDEEIKNYLVLRYGEFILLKPRLRLLTLPLWFFPFFGLLIVFFCVWILKKPKTGN